MIATELHPDTRHLIDLMNSTPVGETVTLTSMTRAIGRDINQCRHLLYSALRVIERDHGAVWASVRGQGYRRMSADEIMKIGKTARDRIRRTARRGIRSMEAGISGANDLPNEAKIKVLREQSALAMIEHVARERNLPPVQEADNRPLPVAVTAREFLKSIGAKFGQDDAP